MKHDGIHKAVATANFTFQNVPAYKRYLKKNGYTALQVRTVEDFLALPKTTKKNYIQAYPLNNLTVGGESLPTAYASSGSSGKPTFWFKTDYQEKRSADIYEKIYSKVFQIQKRESTLVIICFSMGIWVAGNDTAAAFRELSNRGYSISVATPGIDRHDIFAVLEGLAPLYKHVIIAGYPPFLSELLSSAGKKNVMLPKSLKILTSGDTCTEKWREHMSKFAGGKFHNIINIYGCADAGVLGYETPLSIHIRRLCATNGKISKTLFEETNSEPAFVQYEPENIFFEEDNGELLFTTRAGIPLVRYNIKDLGKIWDASEVKALLFQANLLDKKTKKLFAQWPLPFLIKKGRSDVAVTFYALNIFPENLRLGIIDKRISHFLTGNFVSFNKDNKAHTRHSLHILLELSAQARSSKSLGEKISKIIVEKLLHFNMEYRKLYSAIGKQALPKIQLLSQGNPIFAKAKGLRFIQGKKPKIVL